MNLQIDEKKHLRKEILLQIKKIYDEHDTILPDGMFKQICLLIPLFSWSLSQTEWQGKDAPIGNEFFKISVIDIAQRRITYKEAIWRYKGIKVR